MKKLIIALSFILLMVTGFSQTYDRIENNEIVQIGMPVTFTSIDGTYWYKNYLTAPASVHYADKWRIEVTPAYDSETQRLGSRYYDVGNDVVTWTVIDKTDSELAAEKEALLQQIDNEMDVAKIKYILRVLVAPVLDSIPLDSTSVSALTNIYEQWRIGKYYQVNDIVVSDSSLYRVVQAHTSQSDWLPSATPALYTRFTPEGQVAVWVQPTGAQDAYNIGDKVSFEGHIYESLINANVWSPTAYPAGWKEVTA